MGLADPTSRFRSQVTRAAPARVDREKRVIHGYAMCSLGEAEGHGLWIDGEFIDQLARAGADKSRGIKTRFTHPSLSGDGLGKFLGRTTGVRRDGDRALGDLVLAAVADKSPDGELGSYVLDLAEEAPDMFGASIVFSHDRAAERAFLLAHGAEEADDDCLDLSGFISPDARNIKNLPHARLKALNACDVVDDPAANPAGMFHDRQEVAAIGERVVEYALGLTDERPTSAFAVDPDRARGFVARMLSSRGLSLRRSEEPTVPESETATATAERVVRAGAAAAPAKPATLSELEAAYPDRPDFVLSQLRASASEEEARVAFLEREGLEAKSEVERLRKELDAINLASRGADAIAQSGHVPRGGTAPLEFSPRIEVEGWTDRAFTFENPSVRRALSAMSRGLKQTNEALSIRPEDIHAAYLAAGERGNLPSPKILASMSASMVHAQEEAERRGRSRFAMGRATPDYATITVKGLIGTFFKRAEANYDRSWVNMCMWLNPDSNQETETYRWLGMAPPLRVWVGNRRSRGLPINTLTVTNDTFESTLAFDIEDWRFDKLGQLAIRFGELGDRAAEHWAFLVTNTVLIGNPLAYDAIALFAGTHPAADGASENATLYRNDVAAAQVPALTVGIAANPTETEMARIIIGLIQHMLTFRDGYNYPYNGGASDFCVLVPTNMMGAALGAINNDLLLAGISNFLKTMGSSAGISVRIGVNLFLTSTTQLYLCRSDSNMKGLLGQQAVAPEFSWLGAGSQVAFDRNQYEGGVKAVRQVAAGQWAHIIRATTSA